MLEEKIYPFLKKVINLYCFVAVEDENGVCHIPLTHSMEVFDKEGMLMKEDFTFPYLAIMAARCDRGNMCRTMLELYCMGFCSGNSFTVNGDPYQNGLFRISDTNAGVSSDAFTLESGFMVPAALCEMMAHRAGNTIYLAAGIPDEWKEYSAHGITVEGGHKISFTAKNYKVREITIIPGCDEEVQIQCKHAGSGDRTGISIMLKKGIPISLK